MSAERTDAKALIALVRRITRRPCRCSDAPETCDLCVAVNRLPDAVAIAYERDEALRQRNSYKDTAESYGAMLRREWDANGNSRADRLEAERDEALAEVERLRREMCTKERA